MVDYRVKEVMQMGVLAKIGEILDGPFPNDAKILDIEELIRKYKSALLELEGK